MSVQLADALVRTTSRIVDAMRSLEKSNAQIVLALDADGRLVGALTDGDLRRALLSGATLEASIEPYMNRSFSSATPRESRADVIEMMQARRIQRVPIVDDDRRVVGLHSLQEIIGSTERPNWALVMAGGRGTRLLPLTENLPKPMLPVAGRPILERIVLHLVGHGIRRVFISINYLGEMIEQHFGDGERFGCRIDYLRETTALGTGGALSLLPEQPTAPMVALNGDLVVQFDVGGMLEFHERGGYHATLAVHEYTHTVPFGVVEVTGDRVGGLREKPTHAWPTNAGIYVLGPELPRRAPPNVAFPMPALIEGCIERGEPVGAFRIEGDWIDVGRRTELSRARGEIVRP